MAMSESEFEVTKQYWYVIFDVYCTPDPSWMRGVSKVEELLDIIEKRLSNETHPYLPPDVELVRRIAKQIPEEQIYKWEDVSSFRDELVGWFYVEKLDGSHEVLSVGKCVAQPGVCMNHRPEVLSSLGLATQ